MTKEELKRAVMEYRRKKGVISSGRSTEKTKRKDPVETEPREIAIERAEQLSRQLTADFDNHMKKVLGNTEKLIKEHFPARYVSTGLTKLEKMLLAEGIIHEYDKNLTDEQKKKTADVKYTAAERNEALKKVVEMVIEERGDTVREMAEQISKLVREKFPGRRIMPTIYIRKTIEIKAKKKGYIISFRQID